MSQSSKSGNKLKAFTFKALTSRDKIRYLTVIAKTKKDAKLRLDSFLDVIYVFETDSEEIVLNELTVLIGRKFS